MLSVLIPVFNFNVTNLVTQINKQLTQIAIPFEILVCDDASTTKQNTEGALKSISHLTFLENKNNVGRELTRQRLAEHASYDILLFLDADVLPKNDDFISNYINKLTQNNVVFGGVGYNVNDEKVKRENLRLKYGIAYETVSATKRNINPYLQIVSANFLISKTLFLKLNKAIETNNYGYDILFASQLKTSNAAVLHIDNEVYHLGLDSNLEFLQKSEEALDLYWNLLANKKINSKENKLIQIYTFINKIGFLKLFNFSYKIFRSRLKNNLLGKKPSILVFQTYRLLYFCHLATQQNNA